MQINQKNLIGLQRAKRRSLSIQRMKTAIPQKVNSLNPHRNLMLSFKDQLSDKHSLKVFKSNTATVDETLINRFSHNEKWNETYNCPYYGLLSLRRRQEVALNSGLRNENILRNFTLGNKVER